MANNKRQRGTKVAYGTDLNNAKWFGSDEEAMDAANQDLQNANEGRPRLTFIPVPVQISPSQDGDQQDATKAPLPTFLRPPAASSGKNTDSSNLPNTVSKADSQAVPNFLQSPSARIGSDASGPQGTGAPDGASHLPPNVTQDKMNIPRFLAQAAQSLGPVQDSVPDVAAPQVQGGGMMPNFLGGPNIPKGNVIDPTFDQAASIGAQPGGQNVLSPGLTKGAKLLLFLRDVAQGGLAGWGAPTGGEGFLRAAKFEQQQNQQRLNAQQLPFLRQKQQAELNETQARTALYQKQSQEEKKYIHTRRGILMLGSDDKPIGIVPGTEVADKPNLEESFEGRQKLISTYNAQHPDNPITGDDAQQYAFTGKYSRNQRTGNITPFQAWVQADPNTDEGRQMLSKVQQFQAMSHPNESGANQSAKDARTNQFDGDVGGLTESIYGKHTVNGKPDYDAMLAEAHNLQPKTARAERIRQGTIDRINKLRTGEIRPKKRLEDATAQTVMDSLQEDNGQ